MLKLAIPFALITAVPILAQEPPDPDRQAALEARIAELEATVEKLAAVVEGTAKPMNLARTGLAAVSASSVNGGSSLANAFYGIRNAFDDGSNVKDGLSYTYWLTSGEPSPWVEVSFDRPVSLASLFVDGGPDFVARLTYEKGGERGFPRVSEQLGFDRLEHGVRRVRLTFRGGGNVRVNEIRIMGHAPVANLEVRTPRLLVDRRLARSVADEEFRAWRSKQLEAAPDTVVKETERGYQMDVHQAGIPVLRVFVDRHSGQTRLVPLAAWKPLEGAGSALR